MKNKILIITFIVISHFLFGQTATIKDSDGWTNVRLKPNKNSEIIHIVKEGEFFFWVSPEMNENNSNWIRVYIPRNKYSLEDRNIASPTIKGYIHKSKILPVNKLSLYKGSDFHFKYLIEDFDTKGKVIEYLNGNIYNINGRQVYGNDMSTPRKQVKEIIISINNIIIPIHSIFYEDIFECNNNFKIYKLGDLYIVNHWNSDGAGAYEITWVIDRNGIKQRLVGTII